MMNNLKRETSHSVCNSITKNTLKDLYNENRKTFHKEIRNKWEDTNVYGLEDIIFNSMLSKVQPSDIFKATEKRHIPKFRWDIMGL